MTLKEEFSAAENLSRLAAYAADDIEAIFREARRPTPEGLEIEWLRTELEEGEHLRVRPAGDGTARTECELGAAGAVLLNRGFVSTHALAAAARSAHGGGWVEIGAGDIRALDDPALERKLRALNELRGGHARLAAETALGRRASVEATLNAWELEGAMRAAAARWEREWRLGPQGPMNTLAGGQPAPSRTEVLQGVEFWRREVIPPLEEAGL